MRSDELVANALLNLEYTPSPSLLPVQSQLKVYLNDELMGVLPVTKEQLGKKSRAAAALTRCTSPTSTAYGWSLSATTATSAKTRPALRCGWTSDAKAICDLTYQSLKVNNDLSHFPVPFLRSAR